MIRTFRQNGLRLLHQKGDGRKIAADIRPKVERILDLLHHAIQVDELNPPGIAAA